MDIGFIMGASGDKADFYFDIQKKIVKAFLNLHDVSKESARVGVIVYGRTANLHIRLDIAGSDRTRTLTAIDNLRMRSKGNNLEQALQIANHYIFSTFYGGRPGVQKILVVFITEPVQPGAFTVARELLNKGYKIASIIMGDRSHHQDGSKLTGKQDLALPVNAASEAPGAAKVLTALLRSGTFSSLMFSSSFCF